MFSFLPVKRLWLIVMTLIISAQSIEQAQAVAESDSFLNIYTEEMAPYQFIDKNNQIVGINIELLVLALDAEGIPYKLQLTPWSRAFKATLANKSGGLISTSLTRSRLNKFKWVGPFPSSNDGIFLFRLAAKNHVVINEFDDIKNYSLGYVRFGIYEEFFRAKGLTDEHLLGFASSSESYKMLFNDKIDLALGSKITLDKSLARYGFPEKHVVKAFQISAVGGNYLALNLEVPDSIVARLNRRLNFLRSSQQVINIINKYSSTDKVVWLESNLLESKKISVD